MKEWFQIHDWDVVVMLKEDHEGMNVSDVECIEIAFNAL